LDGRVITEALETQACAHSLIAHHETVRRLGEAYKQVNAPFGAFGMNALTASTRALTGDDATYLSIEAQIAALTSQRDALAGQIRTALNAAAFGNQSLNEQQAQGWIDQADDLLEQSAELASP
jgi:hypothetical protein